MNNVQVAIEAVWFIRQRQFCLPKMAHLALAFAAWLQLSESDLLLI